MEKIKAEFTLIDRRFATPSRVKNEARCFVRLKDGEFKFVIFIHNHIWNQISFIEEGHYAHGSGGDVTEEVTHFTVVD